MTAPVDWNRPVMFRDGTKATALRRDGEQIATGDERRRFRYGDENARGIVTVVRVDENGHARADGTESDWDILNTRGAA